MGQGGSHFSPTVVYKILLDTSTKDLEKHRGDYHERSYYHDIELLPQAIMPPYICSTTNIEKLKKKLVRHNYGSENQFIS